MLSHDALRALLEDERLPCALVDLDAFDRNLARLVQTARENKLAVRLATKSVRVPELITRALAGGCAGLMCFSAEEAAELAERGATDLLVAYPTLRAHSLDAIARHRVTLAVDSRDAVSAAQEAGARAGAIVPLVIDVDMSLAVLGAHIGVRRSPLRTPEDVLALARFAREKPNVRLRGLLAYEAQVAGLPDEGAAAHALHLASMREIRGRRPAIVRALEAEGFAVDLVNGGGTGSIEETTRESGVTEITIGSGLFKPTLFDHYRSQVLRALEPALFFALEAVRRPSPKHVTCAGGGYVASGSVSAAKHPTPVVPENLRLLSMEMTGEVQTPLEGESAARVRLGDPILFRPAKAGEQLERFHEVLLVRGGAIVSRAPTYRGLGWTFF